MSGRPRIYTDDELLQHRRLRDRERYAKNHHGMTLVDLATRRLDIPDYVITDRDRRMAHVPTIIACLAGDPPPGQSALDQKKNAGELR